MITFLLGGHIWSVTGFSHLSVRNPMLALIEGFRIVWKPKVPECKSRGNLTFDGSRSRLIREDSHADFHISSPSLYDGRFTS